MILFEVTPDDIFALSDADLRTLVGYLAEQELREQGISSAGVTYGGHQNAKDGGIDVRVDVPSLYKAGYIQRTQTGFQVKAEDFPAGEIDKEMRPDGAIRQSISELANKSGSYIIVSSKGSVADSALASRRTAMRAAVADVQQGSELHVDFYDRRRIASWVNSHPGLIPWVRSRTSSPIAGWQPFSDWSSAPGAATEEYLLDDAVRLINSADSNAPAANIVAGINQMRSVLRNPGGVVRLVGLSGVGKTRLVQALFDNRVGQDALGPHEAVYADLSDGPDPQPLDLARGLNDSKQHCVLIVDNCGFALHQKLATCAQRAGSNFSIITVEYDVTDDESEGTEIFRLEPASVELIEKVLARKHPSLSEPEVRTIARFSEGNSRIALALAQTARRGESLANLKDSDLFKRLFRQNNDDNPALLRAAKAMALVYSFDGETLEGAEGELGILATLAGQSVAEFHGHVAELTRRQLVQRRSKWRALLPHALAHRLAKEALQDFPREAVMQAIMQVSPERMVKSFTRRIGCLHDSPQALSLVDEWLSEGGWLSKTEELSSFGMILFDNIAPVNLDATMAAVENAAGRIPISSDTTEIRHKLIQIARSLGYDERLFDRATRVILSLTEDATSSNHTSDGINVFHSMFHVYLSGTCTQPEKRADFLRTLIAGSDRDQAFAMAGLSAMLKCHHFSSSYGFEFGARKRGYGFHPQSADDIRRWFIAALAVCRDAEAVPALRDEARRVLATEFSNLTGTGIIDQLIELANHFRERGGWPEGWIAVRRVIAQVAKQKRSEDAERLKELSDRLKPETLESRIASFVLPEDWSALDLGEFDHDDPKRASKAQFVAEAKCREIGRELAADLELLRKHFPLLLTAKSRRTYTVFQALGSQSAEPSLLWDVFRECLAGAPTLQASYVLAAFVSGVAQTASDTAQHILDQISQEAELQPYLLRVQSQVGLNSVGLNRINRALSQKHVPTNTFAFLAYGGVLDDISGHEFFDLIKGIAERDQEGFHIALDIMGMRIHSVRNGKVLDAGHIEAGKFLLSLAEFSRANKQRDCRDLAEIARACLSQNEADQVRTICERLMTAFNEFLIHSNDYGELVSVLTERCPRVVLDVLVEGNISSVEPPRSLFRGFRSHRRACPLDGVSENILLEWANEHPQTRFGLLAEVLKPWTSVTANPNGFEEVGAITWTKFARRLIDESPEPIRIIETFVDRFHPSGWSGSLADVLATRIALFDELLTDPNAEVAAWAAAKKLSFEDVVRRTREAESRESRMRDEKFDW